MGERTSWTETWRKGISPEEGQGKPRGEKSLGCSSDSWRDADYKFGVKGVGSDWHIRIRWLKTANKQCSLRSRKEQTADKQAFSPDTKMEISIWVQGVCFGSYCSGSSWGCETGKGRMLIRVMLPCGKLELISTGDPLRDGIDHSLRVASCRVRKLR